jgi:hypothetical protein
MKNEKINKVFFLNLIYITCSLIIIIFSFYMIGSIYLSMNLSSNSMLIEDNNSDYYFIEKQDSLYPDFNIKYKEIKKESKITDGEIKVVYLGKINNLENFKIVECTKSVKNCNENMIIKLNKVSIKLLKDAQYGMKILILDNKQLNLEKIWEL